MLATVMATFIKHEWEEYGANIEIPIIHSTDALTPNRFLKIILSKLINFGLYLIILYKLIHSELSKLLKNCINAPTVIKVSMI